jgi:hypothetical protein
MLSVVACTVSMVLPVTPLDVAEIVVVPALMAVARPASLMEATTVLEDAQVT